MRKKRRHLAAARRWVWCDLHHYIHHTGDPVYDPDTGIGCTHFDWRRVYIESDHRKETFP